MSALIEESIRHYLPQTTASSHLARIFLVPPEKCRLTKIKFVDVKQKSIKQHRSLFALSIHDKHSPYEGVYGAETLVSIKHIDIKCIQ